VSSVAPVKLTVRIKDCSHVQYIFALIQNPKRVGHCVVSEVSFQENQNRPFFLGEFVSDCHAEISRGTVL
jgi:hypothetical protein